MHRMSKLVAGAAVALATLAAASGASALVNGNIVTTVDENGNGTLNGFLGPTPLPFGFQNDPGPGGLNGVLTYDLINPPGLVSGDVLMQDGVGGPILDVVRFNANQMGAGGGTGTLVFYSDNVDGFDSLADTFGPPGALYANNITILEVGTEANNGAIYTPTAGQPGFVAGASAPVVYNLISDNVPEPATWGLMLLGLGVVGAAMRSQRKPVPA